MARDGFPGSADTCARAGWDGGAAPLGHAGRMAYPDKILAPDEDVVAHLHPHGAAVLWPVVRLLLVIGAASFATAMVPGGPDQGTVRLAVLALAVVLLLLTVLVPVLRWRTTHVVVTTHRLLHRTGVLTRRGRDVALAQITDVSFTQTLGQRLLRSGTLRVASAGEGAVVLERMPGVERLQTLLHHMIEEDLDRRAPGIGLHPAAVGPWHDSHAGT